MYDRIVKHHTTQANAAVIDHLAKLGLLDGDEDTDGGLRARLNRIVRPGPLASSGNPVPDKHPVEASAWALQIVSVLAGELVALRERVEVLERSTRKRTVKTTE